MVVNAFQHKLVVAETSKYNLSESNLNSKFRGPGYHISFLLDVVEWWPEAVEKVVK